MAPVLVTPPLATCCLQHLQLASKKPSPSHGQLGSLGILGTTRSFPLHGSGSREHSAD